MTKIDKIMKEIKDDDIEIKVAWIDRNTYGLNVENDKNYIVINLSLFVADTFIHELLHHRYGELTEEQVKDKTNKFLKRLTVAEIMELSVKVIKRRQK